MCMMMELPASTQQSSDSISQYSAFVRLLQLIFPLFKQIESTDTIYRCSLAVPKRMTLTLRNSTGYGLQAIAWNFSRNIVAGERKEYGDAKVFIKQHKGAAVHIDRLLYGLESPLDVWMSHGKSESGEHAISLS